MFVRSLTLSTAFFAVGAQTPPEQFMFAVGFVEIATSACVVFAHSSNAAEITAKLVRFLSFEISIARSSYAQPSAPGNFLRLTP
jgi:hypothetical protein